MVDIKHHISMKLFGYQTTFDVYFVGSWKLIDINQPYTHKLPKIEFSPRFFFRCMFRYAHLVFYEIQTWVCSLFQIKIVKKHALYIQYAKPDVLVS